MQQEDDLRALAKIMEFGRAVSIFLLVVHVYVYCYPSIASWNLNLEVTDKIIMNFNNTTGIFNCVLWSKLAATLLMAVSCLGTKGVKGEKITRQKIHAALFAGCILFFLNWRILDLPLPHAAVTALYVFTLVSGYLCLLMAGLGMSRLYEDDLMEGIENNKYVPLVAARAKEEGARYIPICAKTEEDIADYTPEEKKAFLAEMGSEASGLDNLITASYDLLGRISFLTDGKKECRAWTIRKGTKAPQAAGKIHSDFERGFIRASVIAYSDLEAHDFDYAAVKAKGLQRTEGKEYVVHDGDVIEFLFTV